MMVPALTWRAIIGTCSTRPVRSRDREERRIGRAPFGPERRQDDVHDLVVDREHLEKRRVEHAGRVALGRRIELVVESEAVEEIAQHRVVVVSEAFEFAEWVGHAGQRPIQMLLQHRLVRHVGRHLAKPVHVV